MNIRVFQAFFLALSALCINGSYSETETNPKEMCGEGCQPLEKGDFSEFFCIYRDEEETDHVYYGICRDGAKDSTEISKIKIKDDDFLLKEPLKESVPLHLVPLYRSGEFLNYFAYFLPEEAGICDKLSIVDTRTAKPQDGAFVSGTRIYVNNQTALTLSHDNKTLKKMEKFDLVEEERVSICFTPGTTCTTDIDTLEIVELGKDVKSVYLRNDIFVYAECSKVICSYMLHDFLANTTYYIPQDLKVSSEELDDFGGFLYLVPKIGFDDRFFDDERRFKYSNIPEVSVCEDSIFGPEFTAVKLKKCYLL
uniref:Lipoprotein n=2 Tax=Bursaphelenchus xylophilus TaxID=6326 RepID=A0A1I7S7J6_BURXY